MNILRLSALSLLAVTLMPINAAAHCKGKHTGDHEHCTGGGGDDDSGEYTGSVGVDFRNPSDVLGFDWHIVGTAAQDTITAGAGVDLIEGGGARDEIHALDGNDEVYGEDGDDNIDGGDGDDQLHGGPGNDSLIGGPGTDSLEGGDGNDSLQFSPGASLGGINYESDYYDGGPGYDQIVFGYFDRGENDRVILDLDLNTYDVIVTASGAIVSVQGFLYDIEDVWGTSGDDILRGGDISDNNMYGGEGNDEIYGFGGNDNLIGGQGNDVVYGGPGDDVVGGEPGADLVVGGDGNDVVSGAESGVGDQTDDVLWGGNEDDVVPVGDDTFHFRREFGIDTVMDYQQDEKIHLAGYLGGFWRNDLSFSSLNIDEVGNDIVVSFWLKRGGGTGGTIILKDAAANSIVVDESDFIID